MLAMTLLVGGTFGLPGAAGTVPPSLPEAGDALHAATALADLAAQAGDAGGPAASLAAVGALPAAPAPAAAPRSVADALASLEGRTALAERAFARQVGNLAPGLRGLVDAVATAAIDVEAALAPIPKEERARVLSLLMVLNNGEEATLDEQEETLEALAMASQVDTRRLSDAMARLLAATEAVSLPAASVPEVSASPGAGAVAAPGALCGVGGSSLISPGGLVEIGLTSANAYNTERVLIVDLGGDDCYDNYPAAVGPGSPYPLSVILDLGGNDRYFATTAHPGSLGGATWGMGVGVGGLGLLVDRWGDDQYLASLANEPDNCGAYGASSTWQLLYAQGVGMLGLGVHADLGGNDRYDALSSNSVASFACHWGRVYTFAQGVGARFGVGALLDDTGNDLYTAKSDGSGKADNNVHTHAQGAAMTRAVGVLLDKEGNDDYRAHAHASLSGSPFSKGAFGYTFAQASTYGGADPRSEVPDLCKTFPPACKINCNQVPQLCTIVGPVQPPRVRADCEYTYVALPNGGVNAALTTPCQTPALALLVDILGQDRYTADAGADDGAFSSCSYVWSGVSAQGSSPTLGLAALVDAATDTVNAFHIASNSAGDCGWDAGARAYTAGQGFGGSFMWDFFDAPPFDPQFTTDVSVGILVRGGLCGRDLDLSNLSSLSLQTNDPCDVPWSGDFYSASSWTDNQDPGGTSAARTFAQGAANGALVHTLADYQNIGVGLHVDLFGDDDFGAQSDANGAPATTLESSTYAQAASNCAVAVLVNVGDNDRYDAQALLNGVAAPTGPGFTWPYIVAQADATLCPAAKIGMCPVKNTCFSASVAYSVAVLVEVWGLNDFYSLAPVCPQNGAIGAPYVWGTHSTPVCTNNPPGVSGSIIVGIDT